MRGRCWRLLGRTLSRVVVTHLDSWGLDQFFDRAGKVGLLGCHPAGPPGRIDQAF